MGYAVDLARPDPTSIPDGPGAYLFRDPDGRVIYAGKALSLRKRLASYWGRPLHPRTEAMLEHAAAQDQTNRHTTLRQAGAAHRHAAALLAKCA